MYKYRDTQPISEDPITRTGSIVTIDNSDDVLALHSIKADIEPIQSLNGYDKPWSGGAGKNKCPTMPTTTYNGVTFTLRADGGYTLSGTASGNGVLDIGRGTWTLPQGSYFASLTGTSNCAISVFKIINDTATHVNNGGAFTLTESTSVFVRLLITSGTTASGIAYAQVEQGTSQTAYEPYSNICPISGYDSVVVNRCGVNVWDEEWENGIYNDNTGASFPYSGGPVKTKNYIPCVPNATYFCNKFVAGDQAVYSVFFYDAGKNFISRVGGNGTGLFTTPSNAHYMTFRCYASYGTTYNHDISINYPSTDHEYHAYKGNTYTISLNGTRYGGTLDVASGVLTVDRGMFTPSSTWFKHNSYNHIFYTASASATNYKENQGDNVISNCMPYTSGRTLADLDTENALRATDRVYVAVQSCSTLAEFQAWATNNNFQACYELATPQTVQLTAQEVELLVGQNNIWADSGDVSVTYAIDLDRYVIKPAEAVSINGKYLEDIVKGYRTLYVKGRESLAVDLDTYSVGTSNGEKIKGSKYPARTLTIGFQLLCDTNEEFRQRFNQLNNILSIGEADFVFNDERDKFFTGFPIMDAEVETGRNNVIGEWTLYCAYPFKRSVQPVTLTSTDAVIAGNTATFTFNYDGVMPAKPVLRAEFASAKVGGDYSEDGDCGYVAFLNQDESIIQLGNPDVIDVDADNKNATLINSAFDALTNWTASGITLADITDPYWNKGAGQTMKFARGIGTLTRSIANTINFEFDIVQRLCVSSPTQAGTFKALLKNGNRIIVGYIIEKNGSGTTANVKYILNDIVVGADTIDVSYYNTNFGYCNRTPVYVTQDTYTLVREFKYDLKRHSAIGVVRPVKTGTRQVQDGWNYTQSNLNSGISRSGSVVTFSVGNLPDRTFKSSDIEATPCSNVTFETTGTFNTNAIRSACLVKKAGVPFADIPNVFTAGDIVEADCNSADVFLYRAGSVDGHLEPQYGALGNDWETFEIKVGQNIIRAVWSEWVNTNYKPVVKIIFNKVYI